MLLKKVIIFKFFFILVLSKITLKSYSQSFKGGINIGFVASQVDGDGLGGYNKPGFNVGLICDYLMNEKSYLTMGINYIQKGSRKISNPEIPGDRHYILRLNYIEVPFLYGLKFPIKIKYLIFLEGGLTFGYLIKAMEDVDRSGFIEPQPPFKKYDLPARFGINYVIKDKLFLKFYFSYSLLPIRPHPGNKVWYYDRGQYNNYLLLTLFYYFI